MTPRGLGLLLLGMLGCGARPPLPPIGNAAEGDAPSPTADGVLDRDDLLGAWTVDEPEASYRAYFTFTDDRRFVWGQPTEGDVDECPAEGELVLDDDGGEVTALVFAPEVDDCAPSDARWRWTVISYTGEVLLLGYEGLRLELRRRPAVLPPT